MKYDSRTFVICRFGGKIALIKNHANEHVKNLHPFSRKGTVSELVGQRRDGDVSGAVTDNRMDLSRPN